MYANIETKEKGFNPYVFNAGTVIGKKKLIFINEIYLVINLLRNNCIYK